MNRIAFALPMLIAGLLLIQPLKAAKPTDTDPAVLSTADVARYRQIIADERAGRFDHAEILIASLEDTSLMGYVEAEHLLSPHSDRAKLPVLVKWLHAYSDLPIASRVHALAVKRAPKAVKKRRHHRTVVVAAAIPGLPATHRRGGGYEEAELVDVPLATEAARSAQKRILARIKADDPDGANRILENLTASNRAPSSDIAKLSRRVCTSYLIEGRDEKAHALGSGMAEIGRADAPQLDWCAGLSAFRLQKFVEAAQHFETLAAASTQPGPTRAAAAFWAARSYMRAGNPDPVVGLLQQAATYEPTFYGLLAENLLGEDLETGFSDPVASPDEFDRLMRNAPAHRAVALWQIADPDYAGYVNAELNRGFGEGADLSADVAFAYLARKLGVPNLELRASETSAANGGVLLTGLFPVPPYQPTGGYTIDSALVLAFARIETRFQTNAVSPVGATGLMQLMPATARRIGGAGATREALLDPGYNMSLGQRYIARMLDAYGGNLIKTGAAYNAGPGKVSRWQAAQAGKEDDPLMFLESMRAPETRNYVKRLLAYYWMYHRRNGNHAASLDEAARGEWPIYRPPVQTAPPPPPVIREEENDDEDTGDIPVS
jgi:soluble lytic murein transglycosylase